VSTEIARQGALRAVEPAAVAWQRALELFLDARADSPHTRRAYGRQITKAISALGVSTLDELDGEALARWRAQVVAAELSPSSQLSETVRTPRAEVKRPYSVLTEPEIATLVGGCTDPRDRALIAVLLGGGLRAAEVAALDVADISEDQDGDSTLHVRQGKGRKDRVVPIRGDVARLLRSYLAASDRTLDAAGPLFLSGDRAKRNRDRRLSVRAIGYLVDRLCDQAGIQAKRISPHSCRHTYAIRALRSGASIVSVQKLLGHASLATTQRYVDHLETAELRAAVPDLPLVTELGQNRAQP
jgi:site-specific recombinase XerD